jgi:hypothetical protein
MVYAETHNIGRFICGRTYFLFISCFAISDLLTDIFENLMEFHRRIKYTPNSE